MNLILNFVIFIVDFYVFFMYYLFIYLYFTAVFRQQHFLLNHACHLVISAIYRYL